MGDDLEGSNRKTSEKVPVHTIMLFSFAWLYAAVINIDVVTHPSPQKVISSQQHKDERSMVMPATP